MARKKMTAEERRRKQAETMKNIASALSPKRTGTGQGSSGRKRTTYTPPKEGDTTIKEGNKFIWKGGKWVKATPSASYKAPKEGDTTIKEGNKFVWKGGKWVKASTPAPKPSPQPKAEPTPKPTPKPAAKKPTPKPTPKPQPKPTPGANKAGYEGPGSRGQAPGGYAGKPKKQSLKSQVEGLKKMRMAAEARNKAAAAKKKEEEKKKEQRRIGGSRKPGSM